LKLELDKLLEENKRLKRRSAKRLPCLQCSEAKVTCEKKASTCSRCDKAGLVCCSPSPNVSTLQPTMESPISTFQSTVEISIHDQSMDKLGLEESEGLRTIWVNFENELSIDGAMNDTMPNFDISAFDDHAYVSKDTNFYPLNSKLLSEKGLVTPYPNLPINHLVESLAKAPEVRQ
jgi:hypothetical protein